MASGPWGPGLTEVEPRRVNIKWRSGTSVMQTGFYLRKQAAAAATDQDIADHVFTNFLPGFQGLISAAYQIIAIDVLNIVTKQGYTRDIVGMSGSSNGENLPTFVMCPIAMKAGIRARYGRGSMFWPICAEADSTQDVLSAQGQLRVANAINPMVAEYVANDLTDPYKLIVLHPLLPAGRPSKSPTPLPAVPATWYDVTTVRANPILSSLKSRRAGVGG